MPAKKTLCGNPLFLQWAEEVQRDAEHTQSKSAHTYRKACTSIRSCPIPYARPASLVSLSCVGPKLIEILAERQKEYCEERGIEVPGLNESSWTGWWIETRGEVPMPLGVMGDEEEEMFGRSFEEDDLDRMEGLIANAMGFLPPAGKAGPSNPRKRKEAAPLPRNTDLGGDEEAQALDAAAPAPKKRKTATTADGQPKAKPPPKEKVKKLYVPKPQSGAYALLLGLILDLPKEILAKGAPESLERSGEQVSHVDYEEEEFALLGILSAHAVPKSDLCEKSQPYASASFTRAETGSTVNGNYFTAWSNMKGLIDKGLVGKKGNPSRYWLTVEGFRSALGIWKIAFPDEVKDLIVLKQRLSAREAGATSANAMGGPGRHAGLGRERDMNIPSPPKNNRINPHEKDFDMAITGDRPPHRPNINRLRSTSPEIQISSARSIPSSHDDTMNGINNGGRSGLPILGDMDGGDVDVEEAQLAPAPAHKKGPHDALMRAKGKTVESRGKQAAGGGLAGLGGSGGSGGAGAAAGRSSMFEFWYIHVEGHQVANMVDAKQRLDPELQRPMRAVRLDVRDLAHPKARKLRRVKQMLGGGAIFEGYMMEEDAPARCTLATRISPTPVVAARPRVGLLSSSPAAGSFSGLVAGDLDLDEPPRKKASIDPTRSAVTRVDAQIGDRAPAVDLLSVQHRVKPPPVTSARIPRLNSSPDLRATGSGPPRSSPPPLESFGRDRQHSGRAVNVGNSRLLGPGHTRPPPVLAAAAAPTILLEDAMRIADQALAPAPVRRLQAPTKEGTWQRTVSAPEPRAPIVPVAAAINAQAGPSRILPRLSSAMPNQLPMLDDSSAVPAPVNDFSPSDAITWPGGSFDIILLLDSREVKNKRDEELIVRGLSDKGVLVETRVLSVGDMCWIARSRSPNGVVRECVLDYVCERKRLDDLISSIHGGRYEEQKYRLTNSCIRNVYYIIEDFDLKTNKAEMGLAIATAKSQTQVTNGFFVKDTHRLSETIDYLRIMSEVIKQAHEYETIHILPDRYISRSSYIAFQRHLRYKYPSKPFYTSFETYNDINGKSSSRTLRDIFARMLLCIKGMSAEKVAAVLDVWETPADMWEALMKRKAELQAGNDPTEKRGLPVFFADAVSGEGRQKIGDALSREMYSVLCS